MGKENPQSVCSYLLFQVFRKKQYPVENGECFRRSGLRMSALLMKYDFFPAAFYKKRDSRFGESKAVILYIEVWQALVLLIADGASAG